MKTIFFSIAFLAAALTFNACDSTGCDPTCIDESQICETCLCTEEYAPVCGCDGKTYDNTCFANNAGVTSYTEGACGTGD